MDRRKFLTKSGLLLSSTPIIASTSDDNFLASYIQEENNIPFDDYMKDIHMINTHTGEEVKMVFKENGSYNPEALRELSYFLRDYRTGHAKYIDPNLLDILYSLKVKLGSDKPFYVLSGYRTKKTNELLRRTTKGVAKHSLHIQGKAIDITLPNRSTKEIARAARSLSLGGVGQYNKSHFVHVDTGKVRHWYG